MAPYLVLFALCAAGFAGSAAYLALSLLEWWKGWALPTTAIVHLLPGAANREPYFVYVLLMLSGAGTIATSSIGATSPEGVLLRSTERRARRLLAYCGFPVAACSFIFCISAMWAGSPRPSDFHYANIGGLVPFSDASYYLASAFDQIRDGEWNAVALRRPLAAALRSVLVIFAGLSLPWMLILQACLVAGAACFATRAVVLWRGVWAGIAFFALSYIYARFFVPTSLTEPLGLFWAFLSIPFFIKSFDARCLGSALVAFAITLIALMTRMGSMFTIPALMLWLVWQFGHSIKARLRILFAVSAILLGVFGMNSLLSKIYGNSKGSTAANFSYTLCGLTIGTGWQGCPAKLAQEGQPLQGDDTERAGKLYAMAGANFRAHPEVAFRGLGENVGNFVSELPDVIWRGHLKAVPQPRWLFPKTLTAISLIGIVYLLTVRARPVERTFWALLWASIIASCALIYPDEGPRALAASHPLMVLFFAMGMTSSATARAAFSRPSRLSRYGCAGLATAALMFVCLPWMAHHFSPIRTASANAIGPEKPDDILVLGGRPMSGFLVIADDMPRRTDIACVHLSELKAMLTLAGIEAYQGLLDRPSLPLPFGFIFAPQLARGSISAWQYIVPAQVLERPDVRIWRFELKRWEPRPNGYGEYWFYVSRAEPWP